VTKYKKSRVTVYRYLQIPVNSDKADYRNDFTDRLQDRRRESAENK